MKGWLIPRGKNWFWLNVTLSVLSVPFSHDHFFGQRGKTGTEKVRDMKLSDPLADKETKRVKK